MTVILRRYLAHAALATAMTLVSTWAQAQPDGGITRPKIRLELRLGAEEVPKFRQLLVDFAEAHQLEVRDVGAKLPVSRVMPPIKGRTLFMLSLERPDVAVGVDDFFEQHKFGIYVYEKKSGSGVAGVITGLEGMLGAHWADRLKPFVDQ